MQAFYDFSLSSDTWSPAHPKILEAVSAANHGYAEPYGKDYLSGRAEEAFKALFGPDIDVFFVLNGTGANVAALSACVGRGSGIVCADTAHINTHESGAPEKLLGAKLLSAPNSGGKLLPEQIEPWAAQRGDAHSASPDVVSISQTTELGSVYSPDELKKIAGTAHRHGMLVHMDGARFANAVAALDVPAARASREAGIDLMCFGGTKNGFLFGEAIVFFNRGLAERFSWLHKQHLQLGSKNRYIAAQFIAALDGGLWLETAKAANSAASRLGAGLSRISGAEIVTPVESNMVFVRLTDELRQRLLALTPADVDAAGVTRLVTSFCTADGQIDRLLQELSR
ncbi:threonine aldolase [Clostridia bacterium]|nr:threonine aldolase [Clostridia bacterium]